MVDDVDNSSFLFTRDMMVFNKDEWTPFNCLDWSDESSKICGRKVKNYRQRRCDYFYKKINEIEDNEKLKYDIFMRLKKINGDLFNWSHIEDKIDCFFEMLDALFDSDSYVELNNKLEALESVSNSCRISSCLDGFYSLLRDFESDRYKDTVNNRVIKYVDKAKRPKKLKDRMRELYVNVSGIDLDSVHSKSTSVSDFVLSLGKVNKDNDVNGYIEFCNKYVNKIELDLEYILGLFPMSGKHLFVSIETPSLEGLNHLTERFENESSEDRKKYIINKIKELGLHKEFREKFISCYDDNKYGFLNLYMIALAYEFQKNNFENFSAILDDMAVVPDLSSDFTISKFFKCYVGFFMNCEFYKDMVDMRVCFRKFSSDFDGIFFESVIYDVVRRSYYSRFEDKYVKYELDSLRMRKIFDGREFYCDDFLTQKRGRLTYINNKLYDIESNKSIRDELYSDISKLSFEMFNELNLNDEKDSFVECMEVVFDSDTYYEMDNKMRLLKEASKWYNAGAKGDAFGLLRLLNNDEHKERVNDRVVSYPKNSINFIEKPKSIIDRMKELYPRFDESISYDFLDKVHGNANDYSEIMDVTETKRKSLVGRIKQKLMLMKK